MSHLEEDLTAALEGIWESILGSVIYGSGCTPGSCTGDELHAAIAIVGGRHSEIVIDCSRHAAKSAGAVMLGRSEALLSEADLNEVVLELANIVAGNLRTLIATPSSLGLPRIVESSDGPGFAELGTVLSTHFDSERGSVHVRLLQDR